MDVRWGSCRAVLCFVFSVSLFVGVDPASTYVKPVAAFDIKEHQARAGTSSGTAAEGTAAEGTYRRIGYNPYAGRESSPSVAKGSAAGNAGDIPQSNVKSFPPPPGHQVDPYPAPNDLQAEPYPAPSGRQDPETGLTSSSYTRNAYPARRTGTQRRPGYPLPSNQRYSPQPRSRTYPRRSSAHQSRTAGYPSSRYSATAPRGYPQRRSGVAGSSRTQEYRSGRGYPQSRYSQTSRSYRQDPSARRPPPPPAPAPAPARGYPRSSTTHVRGYPRSQAPRRTYPEPRAQPSRAVSRTYEPGYRGNDRLQPPPSRGYPRSRTSGRTYPRTRAEVSRYPPTQRKSYQQTQNRNYVRPSSTRHAPPSRGYPQSRSSSSYRRPPSAVPAQRRGYPRPQLSSRYQVPGRHYVGGRTPLDSMAARAQSSSYSRGTPRQQNSARYDPVVKNYNQKEFWQYNPKPQRAPSAPQPDYYQTPRRRPLRPYPPARRYRPQPVSGRYQGHFQPQKQISYPRGYPKSYYPVGHGFPQRPLPPPIPRAPTPAITTTTTPAPTTTTAATTVSVEYEAPEVEMMTGSTGMSTMSTTPPPATLPAGTPPPGVPAYIHNPKSGYANIQDPYTNQGAPSQGGNDPSIQYGGYQHMRYYGWDTGAAGTAPPPDPTPFRPAEFKPYRYLNKYGLWETWYPHHRAVDKYRTGRM